MRQFYRAPQALLGLATRSGKRPNLYVREALYDAAGEIERMTAANERLRAALEPFVQHGFTARECVDLVIG